MMDNSEVAEAAEPLIEADHSKLETFQAAVKSALLKKIQEADEELAILRSQAQERQKNREEQTSRLHKTQRQLVEERRRAAELEHEHEEIKREKEDLEEFNKMKEEEILELQAKYQVAMRKNQELKEKHNRVLAEQIILTSRRVKMAGEVSASEMAASKAEDSLSKLHANKKAQDLYIEKVSRELEDIEQKMAQYQNQQESMKSLTLEAERTVKRAEEEKVKVQKELKNILKQWSGTVINIAKRDEAMSSFQGALKNQELKLKETKSEISSVKQEIVALQEKHGFLTSVSRRASKLAALKRAEISKTDDLIEETKEELEKVIKAKEETMETLRLTKDEVEQVRKGVVVASADAEKIKIEKLSLEEKLMGHLRDEKLAVKTTEVSGKGIVELRSNARKLEEKLTETKNLTASVLQELVHVSTKVEDQNQDIHEQQQKITKLQKSLVQVGKSLNEAQSTLDRKQNMIDLKTKELAELKAAGNTLSPLESEIERIQGEVLAVQEYCEESKQSWLKFQNDFIDQVEKRSSVQQSLHDTRTKYMVLNEKNRKLREEVTTLESVLSELKRRIDSKNNSIVRVNARYAEEQTRYQDLMKTIEAKRASQIDKIHQLLEQVETVKAEAESLAKAIEVEKAEASQAAEELIVWEEKVKHCRETKQTLERERNGDQNELESLRLEVHRLTGRLEQVDCQTRMVIGAMEDMVGRRENTVDKVAIATKSKVNNPTKQTVKAMLSKKIADLKAKARKLGKQEGQIQGQMAQMLQEERSTEDLKAAKKREMEGIRSEIFRLDLVQEQKLCQKQYKMNVLLQLQTRAKWYRSIKERRYHAGNQDETQGGVELRQVSVQNEDLRSMLQTLVDQFPLLKRSIQRAINSLL